MKRWSYIVMQCSVHNDPVHLDKQRRKCVYIKQGKDGELLYEGGLLRENTTYLGHQQNIKVVGRV